MREPWAGDITPNGTRPALEIKPWSLCGLQFKKTVQGLLSCMLQAILNECGRMPRKPRPVWPHRCEPSLRGPIVPLHFSNANISAILGNTHYMHWFNVAPFIQKGTPLHLFIFGSSTHDSVLSFVALWMQSSQNAAC